MNTPFGRLSTDFLRVLRGRPQAIAYIAGSAGYPNIFGTLRLYQTRMGVLVLAEVGGLPHSDLSCRSRIFGLHIHSTVRQLGREDRVRRHPTDDRFRPVSRRPAVTQVQKTAAGTGRPRQFSRFPRYILLPKCAIAQKPGPTWQPITGPIRTLVTTADGLSFLTAFSR